MAIDAKSAREGLRRKLDAVSMTEPGTSSAAKAALSAV